MPQHNLKLGALCTAATRLRRRVFAISNAVRATRFDPVRVITRMPIEISSLGRYSPMPATTVPERASPSVVSRTKTMSTSF
jgi:hypothetical protein